MNRNRLGKDIEQESSSLEFMNNSSTKPIELYVFVDPLCPECWGMEPSLKKLFIEYGKLLKIKRVVSGNLTTLNSVKKAKPANLAQIWEYTASRSGMSCDGDLWFEDPISTPYAASIAIKAAELQGKNSGFRFLRKLQEVLFLEKQNISKEEVIIQCAIDTGLDLEEFKKDFHSKGAAKAFQCDLKITSEMEVDEIPTIVFFNENIEDAGIKVTGEYPYEIYVRILTEMLQYQPEPASPPPLEDFMETFKFVATKEIEVVYNMKATDVEKEMKKMLLKQKVERVPVKYGTFWRHISQS